MTCPSAAAIHEAYERKGALPADLQGLVSSMRLHGPAFPVAASVGDNLWLHRAIAAAGRGSVLVVATKPDVNRRRDDGGDRPAREFGYWGELMTLAAMHRGLRGLLIDGWVRDRDAIVGMRFPVFCRGVSLRGTTKDPSCPGALGEPVEIGGISIAAGDLVVGDADGAVVVAGSEAGGVLRAARERVLLEKRTLLRIRAGESTLRVLGLEH